MMDDSYHFYEVTRHLDRWRRRRLWSDILLWAPRGLLAGLAAAAAVAALARFQPILHNREVALAVLALSVLGVLVSLLAMLLRHRSALDEARFFDRLFELQERVSTAVEIQTGRLATTPELARRQLVDTAEAVGQVDDTAGLPFKVHWPDMILIVVAATLLVAAVLLPNEQSTVLAEQEAVAQAITDQVAALKASEQDILNNQLLEDDYREALLAPIRSALRELDADGLSREQAVAVLSDAEANLRELSEAGNSEAVRRTLPAAGESLADLPLTEAIGRAFAAADLAQAAIAANLLAENLSGLSDNEREALASSVMQAAAELVEADPALAAGLADAAEALKNSDLQTAQQSLHEAAATMQRRALEQAAAAQAQATADELNVARQYVAAAGTSDENATGVTVSQGDERGDGSAQSGQTAASGQGAGPGNGAGAEDGQGPGGPGPGGGHADTIFVPDLVDLSAESGAEIELPAECITNPQNCGALISESPTEFTDEQSLVPYEQVFGDYRNAAIEALEGGYIPLGMKSLVRDYFSSLEP